MASSIRIWGHFARQTSAAAKPRSRRCLQAEEELQDLEDGLEDTRAETRRAERKAGRRKLSQTLPQKRCPFEAGDQIFVADRRLRLYERGRPTGISRRAYTKMR